MENSMQQEKIKTQTEGFFCPNCGGGLRHDPKKDKFLCTSCGYEGEINAVVESVQEYSFDDYQRRESESVPFAGMSVVACKQCGCEVTFDEQQTATTCPMCGSTHVDTAKQSAGIPPEGVIPFWVDKKEAAQKFRDWVKGLWFAPTKLKKSVQEGKLTGKFVPFWTYDADVTAPYTGQGGRNRTVTDKDGKETTVTDWYPTAGIVTQSFDDLAVCAVGGEGAADVEAVGPFDTVNGLKPFAHEYLAGYNAELYSIKANEGFETAKERMESTMRDLAASDIRSHYDDVRSVHITAHYTGVTYKHVLLPVWSSLFAYNGKTYRYVVNGANGNVHGQRPYSVLKILRAVLIAAIILFGAVALFSQEAEAAEYLTSDYSYVEIIDKSETNEEGIDNGLVWTR